MAITLTIDGRPVEVDDGATILDAARKLGIDIPTLCHADGHAPFTSCFLCVVHVEGRHNLSPACSEPAADGMVVATRSHDVDGARRMALELLLSDHRGDCLAPCTTACPAALDIPGFIRHVMAGDNRGALALIKQRIALPAALGRVCPRYCERACRRRQRGEPVAICALTRFAAGQEADDAPARAAETGKLVAIVGAGPAGLSAAYYLLQWGHVCTIFDAHDEPGGMFRYGIPEFRLPKAALDADIEPIRRLGAQWRMGVRVGEDIAVDELRARHDAVLLAVGAQCEDALDYEGAELTTSGMEFLHRVASGERPDVGDSVVVIGRGNEAVDAARTALRVGAGRVTLVSALDRAALSCFGQRLAEAEAEGVRIELSVNGLRVHADGSALRVSGQQGDARLSIDASAVIASPGRRVDVSFAERIGLRVSDTGIDAHRRTLATNLDGVFAAGEAVSGPTAGVRAVASGRLAAVAMHQHLTGQRVSGEPKPFSVHMGKLSDAEQARLFRDVPKSERAKTAIADVADRAATFDEVDKGLSREAAVRETQRCLQCDCAALDACKLRRYAAEYGAKPARLKGERREFHRDASHAEVVFESGKCILCGLCVRIAEQAGEPLGMTFTGRGFAARTGTPFDAPLAVALKHSAARCVEACPTGALAFKRRT